MIKMLNNWAIDLKSGEKFVLTSENKLINFSFLFFFILIINQMISYTQISLTF